MKIIVLIMIGFSLLIAGNVKNSDTVRDSRSGLMWQDSSVVETQEMLYSQAKRYCQELSLSGYKDWRLPTVTELQSIVDFKRYDPSINRAFYHTAKDNYWSSTIYADDSVRAWAVDFKSGGTSHNRDSYSYYVRCVRGK